MTESESESESESPTPLWVQRLHELFAEVGGVEEVVLDQDRKKVSVGLSREDGEGRLQERLNEVVRWLDQNNLSGIATQSMDGMEVASRGHVVTVKRKHDERSADAWKWRDYEWPDFDNLEEESAEEWRAMALGAAVCGVFLLLGWSLGKAGSPGWALVICYGISMVAGGWDAAKDAVENLRKGRLDIHFLMLTVALGASLVGAWHEGALLLFLFSSSGAMEHYALHRTHREINALQKSAPKTALRKTPAGLVETPVLELRVGDLVVVRPDQIFPTDGEIEEGETEVDESTLTGEAQPVNKGHADSVSSGTLNMWGAVTVRVTKVAADSALQRVIHLIQDAKGRRAPSQRFTDRFGTTYTWLVLGCTLLMFLVWWLVFRIPPFTETVSGHSTFYRAMTLLVVASPCALVLSIPSAILAAIAWTARKGILLRGGAAVEKLAEVDVIALDKTGTLTTGEMDVKVVESYPPGRERQVLVIAYALETQSNHPIARAITAHGRKQGLEAGKVDKFASLTGKGVRGEVDGKVCYLGRRELLEGMRGDFLKNIQDAPVGDTEVWVFHEDLIGRVLLRDKVREESRGVLAEFAKRGIQTIMLTGDRRGAAEQVARELGVDRVLAGLHPEDKVREIERLGAEGHKVAMVGDGVNDAPSLAAAYVSVSLGDRGSDAAIEQSEVILMQDRLEKLLSALDMSARARRVIRQNLGISLGTVIVMVMFTLASQIPLTLGVVAHEGSTVLVCLNSLRLLFFKENRG